MNISPRVFLPLGAWLFGSACAGPGEIQWEGGRAPLRTALWQTRPSLEGTHVTVALSTSEFPCTLDLVGEDDPSVVTLRYLELQTSACREDARHLIIDLWRDGGAVDGAYPGIPGAGEFALDSVPRFATMGWFAVEEAGVQYIDGINRSYGPIDGGFVALPSLGTGATVDITSKNAWLDGELWLPEVDVSADFHAEECPAGPTLLDDLFDALVLLQAIC